MKVCVVISDEAVKRQPDGPGRIKGCNDIGRLLWGPDCEVVYATLKPRQKEPGGGLALPPADIVVNAVADPDICPLSLARLRRDLAGLDRPLVNRPEAVEETRREVVARRLAGHPAVLCPPTIRLVCHDPHEFALLAASALPFPMLVRPTGSHHSKGLVLCTEPAALAAVAAQRPAGRAWYLTAFVENRGADGLYRKMRMFAVGDRFVPRHLLASEDWNVRVEVRDTLMRQRASLRDAERAFLEAPAGVLGPRARDGLAAIRAAIGLDIFGIDFAPLPDGRVLLFEASANMVMGPSQSIRLERFAYARMPAARLRTAVLDLLQGRIAAAPQGR